MRNSWQKFTASTMAAAALLLGGCSASEEQLEEVTPPEAEVEAGDIGQMFQRITAQQLDAAAQKGVNWAVADAVTWSQAQSCMGCHRQPVPLFGGAISAYTGYQVNTSAINGTAYLAQFLANQQQPAGHWQHGVTSPPSYPYSSSGFGIFGIAGYTQYQSTAYLTSLHRGINWAIGNTTAYTFANPMDGKALQGITSVYVPADLDPAAPSHDIGNHFTAMTGQFAIATRTALDMDQGLTAATRQNYQVFLRQLADSLVGQYVRSNGAWKTEAISYAALGSLSDNRTPTNNASVAAMRDELLTRAAVGGGWGQTAAATPNVYSTGMALYALCRMEVRADTNTTVSNGLTWLANQQCSATNSYCGTNDATKDGSWNWPGHTNDVPTGFAVLAMGCYGSLNAQVTLNPISATLAANLASTQTTSFNVKVKNTGYVRNTYELVPSGNFTISSGSMTISHNTPSMTLDPGAEATDVVTLVLPPQIPESRIIPVSVMVSYDTRSGPATKTVTFNVYIPPQPNANAAPTTTTILSPANGAVIAPGSTVNLSARVTLNATGATVTQGSLTLYTGGVAIATVQPDANGNFSYSWPVPATAPLGSQTFTATYNGFATANFSVNIAGSSASRTITIGNGPGVTCETNAECQSGFCVDGVCCNSACGGGNPGDCQACSRFAGTAVDGTCGTVKTNFICRPSQGFCDPEERCDGSSTVCGADVFKPGGTTCAVGRGSCNTTGSCSVPTRGLNADYYGNTTLSGTPTYSAVEPGAATSYAFDYLWGTAAPNATTPADNFSTRWFGDLYTPVSPPEEPTKYTGRYWFYTQSDQGIRVWVNGKLIINNWTSHTTMTDSGSIFLESGKRYSIVLEYFEGTGSANITLQYQPPGDLSRIIKTTYVDYAGLTKTQLSPAINNPVPVRIKSPLDRSSYLAPANVAVDVEAYALGSKSTLVSVELFRDGVSLGAKTAAPFSWPETGLGFGLYTYQAKATATAIDSTGGTQTLVQWSAPASVNVMASPAGTGNGQGLTADYFNGTNFNSFEFTRTDYNVQLVDGINNPLPADILNPSGYSVRWTGTVIPAYSQAYKFSVQANHPAKVWVKGTLVVDTSLAGAPTTSVNIGLAAGERVPIKVEYLKNSGTISLMKLFWESPSEPKALIPGIKMYPNTASAR
ncbi:PA14 domain-containing protein [Archangium sp.]|uniref:PA14 domain-containing protein n=1 Tax=Archangium sp. TaxID=1872627 RepID=UPI00286C12DD|nr:PA14 domain-containing protein [Archangium sp.]